MRTMNKADKNSKAFEYFYGKVNSELAVLHQRTKIIDESTCPFLSLIKPKKAGAWPTFFVFIIILSFSVYKDALTLYFCPKNCSHNINSALTW